MDQLEALARVPFLERPRPASNIGDAGDLVWLPLNQLYIDREYQRHVLERGRRNIKKMIENFSWALFGALSVGARDGGKYAVIDGQHRAIAAGMHGGIIKVPCIVLCGGRQQEAKAFSAINSNITRLHPLQAFRADVVAGDPDSIATVEVCALAGVTIVPYPKSEFLPGETQSLGNIRSAIRDHGRDFTVTALKMLRAIDPEAGLSKIALCGTFKMLSRHREWVGDAEAIGRKLNRPLAQLERAAVERKMTHGGVLWLNFEHILTLAVQSMLRTKSRFYSDADAARAVGSR